MALHTVITVYNEHEVDLDAGMFEFVMTRVVARHGPQARVIDIYPQLRVAEDAPAWRFPGRIEWICRILYHSGGELTIGCIQRAIGAEYESHS